MSQMPPSEDDLQFSSVEPAGGEAVVGAHPPCVVCHQPIVDTYYAANNKLVCPDCRQRIDSQMPGGSRAGRLFKATLLGILAGLLGAAIWFGIRKVTHYDFGIVAIVVGLLVGGAVRAGSGGRGGRGYQILAVLLTYLAVGVNYAPDLVMEGYKHFKESTSTSHRAPIALSGTTTRPSSKTQPAAASATDSDLDDELPAEKQPMTPGKFILGVAALILLAVLVVVGGPILVAFTGIIAAVIIAFALWEAWKINKRKTVSFTGPYSLAAVMPAPPPGQIQ